MDRATFAKWRLHANAQPGVTVTVVDTYRGGAVRLVSRVKSGGQVIGWQVEADTGTCADISRFDTEKAARQFISGHFGIDARAPRRMPWE